MSEREQDERRMQKAQKSWNWNPLQQNALPLQELYSYLSSGKTKPGSVAAHVCVFAIFGQTKVMRAHTQTHNRSACLLNRTLAQVPLVMAA